MADLSFPLAAPGLKEPPSYTQSVHFQNIKIKVVLVALAIITLACFIFVPAAPLALLVSLSVMHLSCGVAAATLLATVIIGLTCYVGGEKLAYDGAVKLVKHHLTTHFNECHSLTDLRAVLSGMIPLFNELKWKEPYIDFVKKYREIDPELSDPKMNSELDLMMGGVMSDYDPKTFQVTYTQDAVLAAVLDGKADPEFEVNFKRAFPAPRY